MSLLPDNLQISKYPDNRWIVELQNQHFIITDSVKKLLDILSNSTSYPAALQEFNTLFQQQYSEEEFKEFVTATLEKTPLFNQNIQKQKSFIKFQWVLLSQKTVGILVKPLEILFHKNIFWLAFISLILSAILILINVKIPETVNSPAIWVILLYFPTMLLHEFGHAAACKKFTYRNGEIGTGIYFIFPILYTDISAIWHAKKEQRIIGNLAGIYMQLLCMVLFYTAFLMTNHVLFLQLTHLLAYYSFFQLIPFIRSDGYWLLSDLTSIPNLHQKSRNTFNNFVLSPFKTLRKTPSNFLFLILYGFLNYLIFGYFIIITLFYRYREIVEFPQLLLNDLKNIFTLHFSDIKIGYSQISILIFYVVVISFFTNQFKKNKKTRF